MVKLKPLPDFRDVFRDVIKKREAEKQKRKQSRNNKIKKQILKEIGELKNKRGFIEAGLPRFARLFGRDSLIVSWQLMDIDTKIAEKTLKILMRLQGKEVNDLKEEEPGKIIHEWASRKVAGVSFPYPYYGSVDATPLFLIVLCLYFKKTNNKEFLKKYWSKVLAALKWMEKYGDKDRDSFLEYKRKNPKGLFHQAWKDSIVNHLCINPPVAMVEIQGYQYLALIETAKLAKIMEDKKLVQRLNYRAGRLKKEFNEKFWMKDKKYFALALDKDKKQKKTITSNPGHLLFTGIIDKDKLKPVVKRLFSGDLMTPFGIRTHSTRASDFKPLSYHKGSVWPYDNWIIAQGLKKCGFKKEYAEIQKSLLRAYNHIGYLPEFYGVKRGRMIINQNIITKGLEKETQYPQAWSSGAMLILSE